MRKVHKDLVEKGFMIKLDDMPEDKKGLIMNAEFKHFNPWRLVMKMDSVTTPVRMVVDPSMTRMNKILAKGENRIGLIFIMVRCRCTEFIWSSDISKLYNQLYMDDPSLPFSLFLYREELDKEKEPEVWVMVRAWYGIVSTGGQAGFALDKLTEMLAEKYPGAYKSLREDRYVDDILSGEDSKQRREEQIEAVQEVLKRGGFSLKFIARSGEKPSEKASTDGETMKLLGYKWDPEKDELSPGIGELNLNKKLRGERKPNLEPVKTRLDAEKLLSGVKLTRSLIVGKISELFDPCGFFEPIKLQMKLQTPNEAANKFIERVETSPGMWSCSLLAAKSKLMKETIPRNELSAILLCTELAFMVKSSLGSEVEEVIYLTDSTIALSWCSSETIKLRLFVYNRVMTILRLLEWTTGTMEEVLFHIDGSQNLADLLTKEHDIGIETVSKGSCWIEGLPWMKKDKKEMPITSYKEFKLDKKTADNVQQECFPDSFLKEFSTNSEEVQEELLDGDEPPLALAALAARAGRGVAGLLVDPVFHGWIKALRITGYMQGWKTSYLRSKHLIQDEVCRICVLGDHRWDPRNETEKAEVL
ncbi:uncharacterized protein LOC111695291 [Eurytemora carolleeae]|uniref:uncharacterized protein LOC111695291 n=1 Tax=Eurytemora carolleeae TaxID=1294199 RepID=UPI000C7788D6|nr:uncharacterized protein LOC111695291 [Eurytemora carolleeae]|eukprot:XP_023320317.1 uncharacterized protein LOC111695291 [Eurytemora affinis]